MNDATKPGIISSPGIYYGLADAAYRAIPAVSYSTLKEFADCPHRWKHAPPKEVTAAMKYGALMDAMWLAKDISRFCVQPAEYDTDGMRCPICGSITDSAKCMKCKVDRVKVKVRQPWSNNSSTCREWNEERRKEGKEVIHNDDFKMARDACARLDAVPEIKKQRERCDVQVAVVSMIEGIPVKGLIDMVPKKEVRNALGDFKTSPTADPREWGKHLFNMRYHWQAALYLDLWNKESGEDLKYFYHFVSEQDAPHEPCFMPLGQEFISLGRRDVQRAIRMWGECQQKQEFPGYPMNVVIEPEKWMLKE